MTLPGCYKPTVNESETITEAQPFCWARAEGDANGVAASGFGVPVVPHMSRS
jgi:hypothetical protein